MTKNPFINAFGASAYIAIVASFLYYAPKAIGESDSFLAPIAMMSLLTLSAAMMGYIFFYQPMRQYLDGNKQEAVRLFFTSIGTFAALTVLLVALLMFTA